VIESAAVKKDFDADSEWRRGELLVAAIDETLVMTKLGSMPESGSAHRFSTTR
jgi:hypothetical protein